VKWCSLVKTVKFHWKFPKSESFAPVVRPWLVPDVNGKFDSELAFSDPKNPQNTHVCYNVILFF